MSQKDHHHDQDHAHAHDHGHTHSHDQDHTHEHTHSHEHSHSHDHGHSHSHDAPQTKTTEGEMSMEDKLLTLFGHWIAHNDSHKDNFNTWADRAKQAGLDASALALEEAGRLSQQVTDKLKEALAALESSSK